MFVYAIKNIKNGKLYIGRTKLALEKRFYQHKNLLCKGKHPNIVLQRSFNKHGIEAFEFIKLAEANCVEQLLFLENEMILNHKTSVSDYGYNLTDGGDGILGFKHNDETKKRIGEASKQRGGGRIGGHKLKGVPHRKEWVEKIAKANTGKKHSAEWNEKNAAARRGTENKALFKPVICENNGMKFKSIKQAAAHIGCNPDSLTEVLRGRRKTIFGLKFSYIENFGG